MKSKTLLNHQLVTTTCKVLIFWYKISKDIPNISMYYLVVENAKTVRKRIAQQNTKLDAHRKK